MGEDGQVEREGEALLSSLALRVYLPERVELIRDVMVEWLLIGVMMGLRNHFHVHSQDVAQVMTVVEQTIQAG